MGLFFLGLAVFSVSLVFAFKAILFEIDFLKNERPSKFQNHRFSQRFPLKVQIIEASK